MKSYLLSVLVLCGVLVSFAHASIVPTFSVTQNGSNAIISIAGDPNASVELHFGNSAGTVTTIGTTDGNGNFSTPLSVEGYQFGCGKTAYVIVGAYQSPTIPWSINPSACQGLSLNQTSVALLPGQSTIVTATISGGLYISSNTNSSVASASVDGNQITITANTYGNANLTVCAATSNEVCAVISVNVNSSGAVTGSNISFSQNNVTINVGQSQVINIYGVGSNYTIPTNSNSTIVSTNLNGNILTLTGLAYGGSNVTVCQSSNQCGVIYVVVNNNPTSTNTNSYNNTVTPALTSLNITSNNTNGQFINSGNLLTFTLNFNKAVTTPLMLAGLNRVNLDGSGSGPYTGTYQVNGASAIPVILTFNDNTGKNGKATLTLGDWALPTISTSNSTASTPTPVTTKYNFTSFLGVGDNGAIVTALQERLTELGFYSGPTNGKFGPLTESAVKALQKANNIKQAGYVGPSTRAVLNAY